jgi:N-acetylglutamate synthase/N-acetylornithine aminotransferase
MPEQTLSQASVDTKVSTEDVTTLIGDLKVGDEVIAYDEASQSNISRAITAVIQAQNLNASLGFTGEMINDMACNTSALSTWTSSWGHSSRET